jgi:hypothetical protein
MLFPKFVIDEIKRQEGRDLTRFDPDFDFPDHLLPEFPAPIFLTTRPDLGDVTRGQLITIENYYEIFNGILNPKQLEDCGCSSPHFHNSNSTRQKIGAQKGPAEAPPASIAMPMVTPIPPLISSATSVHRSFGIGLKRRACVASTYRGSSVHNAL